MSILSGFAQNHQTLLEKYLLADDPQKFIAEEVKLPQDRHFFKLLLEPLSEHDQELAKNVGLNNQAQKELELAKIWREVRQNSFKERQP